MILMILTGCAGPFVTPEAERAANSLYATYQVVDSRNNRHEIVLVRFFENNGKSVLTLHDNSPGKQILYYIVAMECNNSATSGVATSLTCLFYPNPDNKYPPLGGQNFGEYPPFGPSYPPGMPGIPSASNPAYFSPAQNQYRDLNAQDFRSYPLAMPNQRTTFTLTSAQNMTITDNSGQAQAFRPMPIENGYYLTVIGEKPTLHLALKKLP
jgi:hypothetical protein